MEIILFENEWCTIIHHPNGVETSINGEDAWIDMYEVVLDWGEYSHFATKAEAYEYALQMTTNMTEEEPEQEQEQEEDIPF